MPWRASRLHAGIRLRWRRPDSFILRLPSRRRFQVPYQSTSTKQPPSTDSEATIYRRPDDTRRKNHSPSYDPDSSSSLTDVGRLIVSDYAHLRPHYMAPKYPIVLAHGLMGFDELRLAGDLLPGISYWRGIKEAFQAHGIKCITASVPRTASIPERAAALMDQIAHRLSQVGEDGKEINIVAHSMGGLDARYMISRLCPPPSLFRVRSLTTIATPHRGSSAADMLLRDIGPDLLPWIYRLLARLHIDSGAFAQLTTRYMTQTFNPCVPNDPSVKYFSYGACATPHLFSMFRLSHDLMDVLEGPNDGLVSVRSAKWGEYKGTLAGVTHLDLINWTNRLKKMASRLGLVEERFNAVAFYLAVAEELAKEGF
ncbi:triacylglycerol lipase [Cladophialophora psammophila CBS 110553]|uniref:Triacylglycerol lipase n=1 Tax=Cladophialophora psammophila CBS 110553 TaxID=1182543 RepID=W9WE60_9EURO|nr:triacylglycerol lipase [Cladophialophora psammophila CBS 110553]EXJ66372.1 triacylglycerol lipase [Cladophialophora psammophila CBS 110553]